MLLFYFLQNDSSIKQCKFTYVLKALKFYYKIDGIFCLFYMIYLIKKVAFVLTYNIQIIDIKPCIFFMSIFTGVSKTNTTP